MIIFWGWVALIAWIALGLVAATYWSRHVSMSDESFGFGVLWILGPITLFGIPFYWAGIKISKFTKSKYGKQPYKALRDKLIRGI